MEKKKTANIFRIRLGLFFWIVLLAFMPAAYPGAAALQKAYAAEADNTETETAPEVTDSKASDTGKTKKKAAFNSRIRKLSGGKFIKKGKWYYYRKKNRKFAINGLYKIEGKVYYLDSKGRRRFSWKTIDGVKYYFGRIRQGYMYRNTWASIGGKRYYFTKTGEMATGWQIPGVFGKAISNLGSMTAPLSMILIGATLANMKPRMLLDPSVLPVSALRLLAFPLLFAVLLKLCGADEMTMNLCVILLAMPVASNTAAMAERYGGDYVFASACVSVSTLLSVVTVPLVTWLVQMI